MYFVVNGVKTNNYNIGGNKSVLSKEHFSFQETDTNSFNWKLIGIIVFIALCLILLAMFVVKKKKDKTQKFGYKIFRK